MEKKRVVCVWLGTQAGILCLCIQAGILADSFLFGAISSCSWGIFGAAPSSQRALSGQHGTPPVLRQLHKQMDAHCTYQGQGEEPR